MGLDETVWSLGHQTRSTATALIGLRYGDSCFRLEIRTRMFPETLEKFKASPSQRRNSILQRSWHLLSATRPVTMPRASTGEYIVWPLPDSEARSIG